MLFEKYMVTVNKILCIDAQTWEEARSEIISILSKNELKTEETIIATGLISPVTEMALGEMCPYLSNNDLVVMDVEMDKAIERLYRRGMLSDILTAEDLAEYVDDPHPLLCK